MITSSLVDYPFKYYYHRSWDSSKPLVMFIGLNPTNNDDLKYEVLEKISKNRGYGGFYLCFLFPVIRSKFIEIMGEDSLMLPEFNNNLYNLKKIEKKVYKVYYCWGINGITRGMDKRVKKIIKGENLHTHPDNFPSEINSLPLFDKIRLKK